MSRAQVFHRHTTMNYNSLLPTIVFVLMTVTALVEAAPKVADKPVRSEIPRKVDTHEEFLKKHPELREQFEKLKAMSPEERRDFFKEHPELREKLMGPGADGNADKRQDFLKDHPELKEHLEKLKAMSPEERQAWLKEHPEVAEKIEKAKSAMKEKADNLTPEQKEKLKSRLKERGENLSPEQKEKLR